MERLGGGGESWLSLERGNRFCRWTVGGVVTRAGGIKWAGKNIQRDSWNRGALEGGGLNPVQRKRPGIYVTLVRTSTGGQI